MRIETIFSIYFWSWIIQIANYFMNINLCNNMIDWFLSKKILSRKSHFDHLRKFDCKTYAFNKYLFRKNKLIERVHFGFLFDYNNINIFFVWISSQKKMIKIKNIMFHKKKFYKSDKIDLLQLMKKLMIEIITYDVFMLFMILLI